MKNRPGESRHKRIILYYVLILIVPGLMLGTLAFRGIRNERIRLEKQERQEMQLLAFSLFDELDRSMDAWVQRLDSTPGRRHPEVLIAWSGKKGEEPRLSEASTIWYPDGSLPVNIPPKPSDELETLRRLEFMNRDDETLLVRYEQLSNRAVLPGERWQALLGMIRVLKSSGREDQTIPIYETLYSTFANEKLADHLPVGAVALAGLIRQYRASGDTSACCATAELLLRFLLDPPVAFEESAYRYLLESSNLTDEVCDPVLMGQLNEAANKAEHASALHAMRHGLFMSGSGNRRYLQSDRFPGLFVLTGEPEQILRGWVLDLTQVIPDILRTKIDSLSGRKVDWRIDTGPETAGYGAALLQDPVRVPFGSGYPDWVLELKPTRGDGSAIRMAGSQGLLMLVFVFILVLMVAGLVFMLHTLNQEMKLNRMKSHFISNVSHEFKTPLTSIRHMTEVMYLKRIESEERKSEYLKSMLEQCDHLGHLIENILDFSRIDADVKNYRFEALQLDEMLQELIPVFQGRISGEDFSIDLIVDDPPPPLMLDRDAMMQVFFNLLDNGYKYSNGGRRMEVRVSGLRGLGVRRDEVVVEVRDWGMGIAEKDLPRIFDRFYRGDRLRLEGIKGSGIGLTIVQRIVQAHGGRMEVESEVGKGSAFRVILPIEPIAS